MACGGCGVISVVSNLAPIETLAITNAALKQDWKLSLESQLKLLPLIKALFIESNPIPLKAALALKGLISSPSLRLPLVSASSETVESLKALLNLK